MDTRELNYTVSRITAENETLRILVSVTDLDELREREAQEEMRKQFQRVREPLGELLTSMKDNSEYPYAANDLKEALHQLDVWEDEVMDLQTPDWEKRISVPRARFKDYFSIVFETVTGHLLV